MYISSKGVAFTFEQVFAALSCAIPCFCWIKPFSAAFSLQYPLILSGNHEILEFDLLSTLHSVAFTFGIHHSEVTAKLGGKSCVYFRKKNIFLLGFVAFTSEQNSYK